MSSLCLKALTFHCLRQQDGSSSLRRIVCAISCALTLPSMPGLILTSAADRNSDDIEGARRSRKSDCPRSLPTQCVKP
jgi:hypothetical protein